MLVLLVVEIAIRRLRLERIARMLGVRVDLRPSSAPRDVLALRTLPPKAQRQLRMTWKVADVWPFSRGPCLRRALVAGHLLRRLDPAIRLGVANAATEEPFEAHAWLELRGRPLEDVETYRHFGRASPGVTR